MTYANRFFGKIALLSVMLVGISAGSAYASDHKAKPAPASTMKKTAAPAAKKKAKTAKKKRHHARRSTSKSTKKS